jgi:hypothetical protein
MKSISFDINYNLRRNRMPSGMIQSLCRACGQKYILKKEGSSTRLSFIFQVISALTFICYASAGAQ